jgi:hypothetical protein
LLGGGNLGLNFLTVDFLISLISLVLLFQIELTVFSFLLLLVSFLTFKKMELLLIRVFAGGEKAGQIFAVEESINRMYQKSKFKVEYMTGKEVNRLDWNPSQLIDWFLAADYHFITTQIHQWIPTQNLNELRLQLLRLFSHKGFPSGMIIILIKNKNN